MGATATLGRWVRRGVGWAARAVGLFLLVSVFQVLAVRFVDPPFTLTMVDRAIEARAWPAHRSIALEEAGRNVPRALLASEDGRFFLHDGFDWDAICAALEHNEKSSRLRGGSTLTQQVAKNVFLWQERSWLRKGLEAWYTALLELLVPKRRILELYLDIAETGPLVFGVEAGARHHFGKSAKDLSLDEAGRLAGLLPDPRRRSVTGSAAAARAAFVAANPAPFPEDPGFDDLLADWRADGHGPSCLLDR